MTRRVFQTLLLVELIAAIAAVGLRLARPAAPRVNLARLPPQTATDLERLRHAANGGGAGPWLDYGKACLASGFLVEAETSLQQALALAPHDLDALWFLARTQEKLGDPDQSIATYLKILEVAGSDREPLCWYRIGKNHLRAERLEDAVKAFKKAPQLPAAVLERARLLLKSGDFEEAIPLVQELQQRTIPDVYVEMLAVEAARQKADLRGLAIATERLERAHGILESQREWQDLESIRAGMGLESRLSGVIQLMNSRQERQALWTFQQILSDTPAPFLDSFAPVAIQLALHAHDVAALESLAAHFRARLSLPPLARHYIAQAYWEARDEAHVESASRDANDLLAMTETTEHLARIVSFRGDRAAEQRYLALAWTTEGTTQYRLGQLDRAIEMLKEAVAADAGNAQAWFYLGEVELARNHQEQAITMYQRCLEKDPRFGRAAERVAALTAVAAPGKTEH